MFTAIDQVYLFMERGGDVLYALLLVIFLLWLFILERIVFFSMTYRPQLAQAVAGYANLPQSHVQSGLHAKRHVRHLG